MKKHPQRFPGVLEVRKSTGDYGILFTVPLRHLEHIKPLLEKEGLPFFVTAQPTDDLEQAEELVKNADNGRVPVQEHIGAAKETTTISVERMSEIFDMTTRRVEQLEKEGIFSKIGHNRYDLLRSSAGYVQDRKTRNKTSVLNQRREENLEKKNRELDRQHAIEMGKLHRNDDCLRLREAAWGEIRKKLDYLPALTPDLVGLDHAPMEKRLKDFRNELYKELYRPPVVIGKSAEDEEEGMDDAPPPQRKKKGKRKKKAK